MNWSLNFAPLIPWPWLAALAVVIVALVIPAFWRQMRGAWLRGAAALRA